MGALPLPRVLGPLSPVHLLVRGELHVRDECVLHDELLQPVPPLLASPESVLDEAQRNQNGSDLLQRHHHLRAACVRPHRHLHFHVLECLQRAEGHLQLLEPKSRGVLGVHESERGGALLHGHPHDPSSPSASTSPSKPLASSGPSPSSSSSMPSPSPTGSSSPSSSFSLEATSSPSSSPRTAPARDSTRA